MWHHADVMTRLLLVFVLACSGSTENRAASNATPEPDPEPTEVPVEDSTEEAAEPSAETAGFVDERGIRWRLSAEPAEVTMADRATVRLTIEATNEGDAETDPQQHRGQWLLQGEMHHGLNLWFGNGVRPSAWHALPAGETVTDARVVGEQLFEAPGTYDIAFQIGEQRATARVVVAP